jgi:hypothetical protein
MHLKIPLSRRVVTRRHFSEAPILQKLVNTVRPHPSRPHELDTASLQQNLSWWLSGIQNTTSETTSLELSTVVSDLAIAMTAMFAHIKHLEERLDQYSTVHRSDEFTTR